MYVETKLHNRVCELSCLPEAGKDRPEPHGDDRGDVERHRDVQGDRYHCYYQYDYYCY